MREYFSGGSSGIGRATAINLAKRGARIIIASRNEAKGQAAVKYISGTSGTLFGCFIYSVLRLFFDCCICSLEINKQCENSGVSPTFDTIYSDMSVEAHCTCI